MASSKDSPRNSTHSAVSGGARPDRDETLSVDTRTRADHTLAPADGATSPANLLEVPATPSSLRSDRSGGQSPSSNRNSTYNGPGEASPSRSTLLSSSQRLISRASYLAVEGTETIRGRRPKANRIKSYDDSRFEDEMNLPGSGGNGVRVWYESYSTIDWIHDAIKESSRLRRIRAIRGVRGALVNGWDRFQGWLIVTITGIVTALIAGCIVKSEAVLFDLKDGYCERNWRLAKRFCCPYAQGPDWDSPSVAAFVNATSSSLDSQPLWTYRTRFLAQSGGGSGDSSSDPTRGLLTGMGNRLLAGWAGPVASSPAWNRLRHSSASLATAASSSVGLSKVDSANEDCPGWITWGEKFSRAGEDNWIADYTMYILIALLWATIASVLTIYLTSSELYISTKNSVSLNERETAAAGAAAAAAAAYSRTDTVSSANPSGLTATPEERDAEEAEAERPAREDEVDETTSLLPNGRGRRDGRTGNGVSAATNAGMWAPKKLHQIANEQRAEAALPPRKVLYFATGSGISEVKCILSGFVIHGYLGFWTLFTKSVGLTLSVASGLSLGKEGPFVHIASCVGNIICRVFPKYENNEAKRREILSCACAAGVAVAFGAPVGGVLFSLEEVSYYFSAKVMFRSFFCAMVAAATLRAVDPFGTGKIVLFQVTYDKDWHFNEMVFFIIIGIFGGLYGAYFTKLNMFWSKNVRAKTWMTKHPILEVGLITVVTVAFSFLNGYTRMGGVELIADLFSECHEHESMEGLCVSKPSEIRPLIMAVLFAMIVKGVLTIITFGIKLPAGIFIPTLAVGACFGRIVGLLVQYLQWTRPDLAYFGWCPSSDSSCIVPGVYAMIGAAATLSGVTRTTVSLAVIMFELTGTLTYTVPVMLSILVAKTIADALEHKGIYDLVIDFSGLPFLDQKAEYTWKGVHVPDAMDTSVELIWLEKENTVSDLSRKLQRLALGSGYTDGGFPIVVRDPSSNNVGGGRGGAGIKMVGYIAAGELEHSLKKLKQSMPPGLDLEETVCYFRNLPSFRTEGGEEDRDSLLMTRDSALYHSNLAMADPQDLSLYVDKAPITVSIHSPLELVHQYFTRLGVRYLVVVDQRGHYRGVIFKKRYLKFLSDLEKGNH